MQRPAVLRPERRGRQRSARQAAASRLVREAEPVPLWARPHSAVSLVGRYAAKAPSYFRLVAGRPLVVLSAPAWWQVPATAWRRPVVAAVARVRASPSGMKAAVVVESSVWPVASAPLAPLPVEGAAAVSDAKVPPQGVAGVLPVPSVRRPAEGAVAEVPVPLERPPGVGAASDAGVRPPEAVSDAVAELQPAGAAAALRGAEAPQPEVVVERPARALLARQPAERPLALPSARPEGFLPWLALRRAARSAHATRRSRTASPSRQSWRAEGCEGLS